MSPDGVLEFFQRARHTWATQASVWSADAKHAFCTAPGVHSLMLTSGKRGSGVLRCEHGLQGLPVTLLQPNCHLRSANVEKSRRQAHTPSRSVLVRDALALVTPLLRPAPGGPTTWHMLTTCKRGVPGPGILKKKRVHLNRTVLSPHGLKLSYRYMLALHFKLPCG